MPLKPSKRPVPSGSLPNSAGRMIAVKIAVPTTSAALMATARLRWLFAGFCCSLIMSLHQVICVSPPVVLMSGAQQPGGDLVHHQGETGHHQYGIAGKSHALEAGMASPEAEADDNHTKSA